MWSDLVQVGLAHHVPDEGVEPLAVVLPMTCTMSVGHLALGHQPGPDGVVEVVADVGDDVGDAHHLGLQREGLEPRPRISTLPLPLVCSQDPVARLEREVEARPLALDHLDHPHRLRRVVEAALDDLVEHPLAGVAEGRVARGRAPAPWPPPAISLSRKASGDGARHLRDLEGVGEAGAVVVADRRQEDLGLALEAPERLAVEDAIAVALVGGAQVVGSQRPLAPAGLGRAAARGWRLRSSSRSSISRTVMRAAYCTSARKQSLSGGVCGRGACGLC